MPDLETGRSAAASLLFLRSPPDVLPPPPAAGSRWLPHFPFVRLWAELSRAWINYMMLSLFFLIWRLYSVYTDIQPTAQALKAQAIEACYHLESEAAYALSQQQVLADRAQKDALRQMNESVQHTLLVLIKLLETVISLLMAAVLTVTSLVTCFMLAVAGVALKIASIFVKPLQAILQGTVDVGIKITNGLVSAAEKTASFFKKLFHPRRGEEEQTVNLPRVADFQIPFNLEKELQKVNVPREDVIGAKVNESLWTLVSSTTDQLRQKTKEIQVVPEKVFTFQGILPLEAIRICDQPNGIDWQSVDGMASGMEKMLIACMGLVGAGMILVTLGSWIQVWRRHKKHELRVRQFVEGEGASNNEEQPDDNRLWGLFSNKEKESILKSSIRTTQSSSTSLHYVHLLYATLHRGLGADFGRALANRFSSTLKGRYRILWTVDYLQHKPVGLCWAIGCLGMILSAIQWQGLNSLEDQYMPQVVTQLNVSSTYFLQQVNDRLLQNTAHLTNETNRSLLKAEQDTNAKLFEPVNGFAGEVKARLSMFRTEESNHIQSTLGLSIFVDFVRDFVQCFMKHPLDALEKFLGLLEAFKIQVPLLPPDLFQFNQTRLEQAAERVRVVVLGYPLLDGQGAVQGYRGGLITEWIQVWRRRVWQEFMYSALTVAFGWLLVVQLALVHLVFAVHDILLSFS